MEAISKNLQDIIMSFRDELFIALLDLAGEVGKSTLISSLQNEAQKSLKQVENDSRRAEKIQRELLAEILDFQKDTEYGTVHDFKSIDSAEEFCSSHPLTNYEHYREIIDEIANTGNYQRLVAEQIILLQQTSGTTGASKLIPRTSKLTATLQKAFLANLEITRTHYLKGKSYGECTGDRICFVFFSKADP